jgi:NAD(P)-dependent dehydrogenase (short-subunit alcohol dehydrogenase family)
MNSIRFDDRVAIVTGAGGGIGECHAMLLASRGAKVVVNDLGAPQTDGRGGSSSMADEVVAKIRALGGDAVANYDSVSTPAGGEAIVQSALEHFGRLDIVVNNAGILRDRSFAKLEWADLDAVIDVHLKGAFYVSKPAFQVMKTAGYGRFVFTSSASGLFGNFGQSNYGAAKAGVVGLANVLGIEGQRHNILANSIAPIAKTRMTEELLGSDADVFKPEQTSPVVAYLCSAECQLNQAVFSVGGGRVARIFTGLTRGWIERETMTIEAVRDNLDRINDLEGYIQPSSIADETELMLQLLQSDTP